MNKKKIIFQFIIFSLVYSINSLQLFQSNSNEYYNNLESNFQPKSSAISSFMDTNKENYSIFDDVTVFVSFEYGINLDTGTYFTFAFSSIEDNFTGIIFESEHLIELHKNNEFTFYVKDYGLNISDEGEFYYILFLFYGGTVLESYVHNSTKIFIEKESLDYSFNINGTEINYYESINVEINLFAHNNFSLFPSNSTINYEVINRKENLIWSSLTSMDNYGLINITFFPKDYGEVGDYEISIIYNGSQSFKYLLFKLDFNVIRKGISIHLNKNTPNSVVLKRGEQRYLSYPVWINIMIDDQIKYDSQIIPILDYNHLNNSFINYENGTYLYLLKLENYEQSFPLRISVNSTGFFSEEDEIFLNITKREAFLDCNISKILNYSEGKNTYIFFKLVDAQDYSNLTGFCSNFSILYYHNSEWKILEEESKIENNNYFFNLTSKTLNILHDIIMGDLLMKISFTGNNIFFSENSSEFIIVKNPLNIEEQILDSNSAPSPVNLFNVSIIVLTASSLIGVGYYGIIVYNTKFKKEFHLKRLKI